MRKELFGVYLIYKAVMLIKNTAMRIGEVLYLPYDHINLARGEIEISNVDYKKTVLKRTDERIDTGQWRPKGNKSRRIIDISKNQPLLEFLQFDIDNKPDKETMFLGDGTGVLYFGSTNSLTKMARRYVDKTEEITNKDVKPFHSLRGWGITFLLSLGIPIPEVQNMVGHEEITTTIGYFNKMQNASGDSIGRLGNVNETAFDKMKYLDMINIQ